jgi:shikimate kinase
LLLTRNPKSTLKNLYDQRVPTYALADMTVVSVEEYSIEDMVDRVVDALIERPDVLEVHNA